ncbi:hypothetical protein K438DRAFT_1553535, partial [Mycena galopus ATCC 62051]
YKLGKVALQLQGWQAEKKVVVLKQLEEGTKERPCLHAIVIKHYVVRDMGQKKL